MSLFNELKRRNVFRVGIAYAVSAWIILQVADVVGEIMQLPEWGGKLILLMLVVGFVPALIFAWAYELTPEGIKREKDVDRSQSMANVTGRKLDRAIMLVMAVALAWFAWDKFGHGTAEPELTKTESAEVSRPDKSAEPKTGAGATPGEKSIAVLPFANMSNDPDQEYFSDGLAEELLNRLAKIDALRVAARTSAFQFKGQNLDVAEIGRQLKVDNVLEGSVRKSGNRVRITAQLISAANGYHLWSETYERQLDDIFAIQDDISAAITGALEVELGMTSPVTGGKGQHDLDAYNLYLQARYFLARRGGDNMLQAVRLFEQTLAMEPDYIDAWSGLAFNYSLLPNYSTTVTTLVATQRAVEAAERALALNPDNAEALVARGRVRASYLWDWASARADFEHAIAVAPNDINTLNLFGDFLNLTGEYSRAEPIKLRLAHELDPLSPVHANDLSIHYTIRGMYEEALKWARQAARLDPDNLRQESLIWALLNMRQFGEARELMDQYANTPNLIPGTPLTWRLWDAYLNGDIPTLRASLAELIAFEQSQKAPFWSTNIAFITLWLDGPSAALPWLERAYEAREFGLLWPDPFLLPEIYSDDPDWLAFWQRPGLAELMDMRRAHGQSDVRTAWLPRPKNP